MAPFTQLANPMGVTILDAIRLLTNTFSAALPKATAKRFEEELGDDFTGLNADYVRAEPLGQLTRQLVEAPSFEGLEPLKMHTCAMPRCQHR